MNISIVIPAYNEEKSIGKVIDNLQSKGYKDIIVVDDGSKDNTYQIAKEKGVEALKHMINRGQGAALQTGNLFAIKNGANIIVHFDADGQHNVNEITSITEPIIKGETEACLGSRFLRKQKIPFKKRIVLKGAIFIIWMMYKIRLTDAHNGFRAFSREAAKKVKITTDKMEHASEIVEEIKRNKIKYKEIPVTITYNSYAIKKGQKISNSIKILSKMLLKKLGV
tara:strand:+ start:54 stop:725 length:672 start_codon:yes stop_codon:yes gene_type:complete